MTSERSDEQQHLAVPLRGRRTLRPALMSTSPLKIRAQTARASERPASGRGHWATGRPPGHTGCQVGEPLLVRV
jgi:hypothetical protein